MRPEVGAEGFGRQEFHAALEQLFEERGEGDEGVKGFAARLEFHQHIDVALGTRLLPHEGTKEPQASDAKATEALLMGSQEREHVVFGLDGHEGYLLIV